MTRKPKDKFSKKYIYITMTVAPLKATWTEFSNTGHLLSETFLWYFSKTDTILVSAPQSYSKNYSNIIGNKISVNQCYD